MQLKYLAHHTDAIPIIARWYYDEWGYRDPSNSFEKTQLIFENNVLKTNGAQFIIELIDDTCNLLVFEGVVDYSQINAIDEIYTCKKKMAIKINSDG